MDTSANLVESELIRNEENIKLATLPQEIEDAKRHLEEFKEREETYEL